MKVSVIIPVYNTKSYLSDCINSVLNQTFGIENIEIIIVDDGSTDSSGTIIKKIAKKCKKIKYFKQKNKGQASARNFGLSKSTGEYIHFLDSDDYIDNDMYSELYNVALKNNSDIVSCDYTKKYQKKDEYISFNYVKDANKNFIIMNTGPCNMIIKRKFLIKEKFKFKEDIIYEDLSVIPSLAINGKITYIQKSFYNYNIHSGSTMIKKEYSNKLEDIFLSLNNLTTIFNEKDILNKYGKELEFLYIRRLMMSASLRFIEFGDPHNCIKKISLLIRKKYPNWKKNKYYKLLPIKQKIVALMTYNNNKFCLKILNKVNRRINEKNSGCF